MRAVFLCENLEKPNLIYDWETREEIRKYATLEDKVYTKADILDNPEAFSDVEIVFSTWGMPVMTEEEICSALPSLKCVFYGAGTVQTFARPHLKCGVKVFSAWAANAVPVAETTVAEIILANKGFFLTSRLYHKKGRVIAKKTSAECPGTYGETVGIIGAGMIGRLVIEMLHSYKVKILVFDPFLSDERAKELGVEKCSLTELFERSFVVSNHLANNEKTRGMINYDCFSRMRDKAVFINTGRGAQVVEDDLVRILREREDITALLDVTDPEPPVDGHPFYTLENCVLTPHIAGSIGDEVKRMGAFMKDEFILYVTGEKTRYEVTEKMLETMA